MQVQRRVKELLGEREAVARSARYVLRAFADWGVIVDSARKGEYSPCDSFPGDGPKVATWLLEAAVTSAPDGVYGLPRPGQRPMSVSFPDRPDRVRSNSQRPAAWKLSGMAKKKPSFASEGPQAV